MFIEMQSSVRSGGLGAVTFQARIQNGERHGAVGGFSQDKLISQVNPDMGQKLGSKRQLVRMFASDLPARPITRGGARARA